MSRDLGRPWVGVTCGARDEQTRYVLNRAYCEAVQAAGGLPVILPFVPDEAAGQVLDGLDGLLLTGGPDVDPALYGRQRHPRLGTVDPGRDAAELALCRAALARRLPVLAICRGIQLLAVAAGGTLIQDIPSGVGGAVEHYPDAERWQGAHAVEVAAESRLAALMGVAPPPVNSFHHQAVDDVPPGFVVTARAPDGVIEAMEHPDQPFCLGVEWHPEEMWAREPAQLALFDGFVAAAARYRAGRAGAGGAGRAASS